MNVTTREQFDAFLADLNSQEVKVFDTETNGLRIFKDNHMVSLSVYFPEVDRSYNLPFYHGYGSVDIKYTDAITPETPFAAMSWQGKTKKQKYLSYWFNKFVLSLSPAGHASYFGNLPEEWLEEIKAAWGRGVYIGHNTRFDAHVLNRAGFPDMDDVVDTMVNLHIVFEDWRHVKRDAPYTWTHDAAPTPELYGQWARDAKGNLLIKKQWANRQLKWQTAHWQYTMNDPITATEGEEQLAANIQEFRTMLLNFIMENIHDEHNDGLVYVSIQKGKGTPADWVKQRERISEKLVLDDKAHLWMLPSSAVSDYAEHDVRLTWELYKYTMLGINEWHNEQLMIDQNNIHHKVAWEMERNGFRLNVQAAHDEIDKLNPRIEEVETILRATAAAWGVEDFNPNSPYTLLQFLNSGVLGHDYGTTLFPAWWDVKNSLGLKTYVMRDVTANDLIELTPSEFDELKGTDKRELERVEDHPIVRLIRELRRMHKTVSTYLIKWINAADRDYIVHGSIDDTGTVSGRASSSGDAGNLQNIPDRGGYTVKRAVIPYGDEWRFFAIDYGQLELRLAAWIAEGLLHFDPAMTMTNLFLSGNDMHSYVRDMIEVKNILYSGMSDEDICSKIGYNEAQVAEKGGAGSVVADHCRQVAKTMNFGLLYSGGAPMLSKLLKIEEDPARTLVKKWRTLFPAFSLAQQHYTSLSTQRRPKPNNRGTGMYVTQPLSGRHRKLHLYDEEQNYLDEDGIWKTFSPQAAASKKTWNNVVQGLGGYLAMYSAYKIGELLGRDNLKFFANIHDALEGQVHIDYMGLVPDAAAIMVDWPIIPNLTVDIQGSTDGTWQGLQKIADMNLWITSGGTKGYPEKRK